MGIFEADDISAEFRQLQPERHLAFEHAALAVLILCAGALAGDHQHEFSAVALRRLQEAQQRGVGLALRLAVQIDARVDVEGAAGKPLLLPTTQRLEARYPLWRRLRRGCRAARPGAGAGELQPSPQRHDRAGDPAPERALLLAQPSSPGIVGAHDRGERAGPACRRGFFAALASSSLLPASSLDLPPSFLTSSFFGSSSGIFGFATGSGMCLPASIMSSSRGSSITKRPGWRMRPARGRGPSPPPQ